MSKESNRSDSPDVAARARLLYCGPATEEREALLGVLESSQYFEVVGRAESGAAALEMCRAERPDVLVLDAELVGMGAERIARTLTLERPLPTLLLVEGDASEGESPDDAKMAHSLRIYRLDKARLRQLDGVNEAYLRTRLNLLAARANEPKKTLPSGSLREVINEMKAEEADAAVGETAREIASFPLDLVLLAGGAGSVELLADVIPHIAATRVPILVAIEEPESAMDRVRDLTRRSKLAFHALTQPVALRRASGIIVALGDRAATVTPEVIRAGAGPLNLERVLTSMGSLGRAGFSVLLAEGATKPGAGLAAAARQSGLTAALAWHGFSESPAAAGAKAAGHTPPAMTAWELAWLLGAAIPRRV